MIKKIISGMVTYDGAGVRLSRLFGHDKTTDPFLLLDHFGSDKPEDYVKGFPWHPHRGIETVTYMFDGEVEHGDSLGNNGIIGPGDIQWMSSGSGIIHQEMPKTSEGMMQGIQLWVNMPAKNKMMKPLYRGFLSSEIPILSDYFGQVKIISGKFKNKIGPVKELAVDIDYFDFDLIKPLTLDLKKGHTCFCYIYYGKGEFNGDILGKGQLVLLHDIDKMSIKPISEIKFIFVSGKPLNEPIAWGGPIVMNSQEELDLAFKEIDDGTFIKK